ncbi:MAG: hypothetical protein HUJ80_09730 [Firmicutes bacterium]|nr:hypothetical protein [Bacillota bacterium]
MGQELRLTRQQLYDRLVDTVAAMGYPRHFGELIASSLGTEKTMDRMLSYLHAARPSSMEEIADEMLAIKEQFEGFRQKKINEYHNSKINRLLNEGLGQDEEE